MLYIKRKDQTMGNPWKTKHVFFLCIILILSIFFIYRIVPTISSCDLAKFDTCSSPVQVDPKGRKFTLLLKVLAYNRFPSVARCLRSLSSAHYNSDDDIHLHIYLDHQEATSYSLINQSHHILDFVDSFSWPHGDKVVHYRTANAGLQAQWIEAWWPTSDDEFAFVLEDDLEVSPLYYSFVKTAILHFYYNKSNFSPLIYGISLQLPRFVPGKHGNKINLDSDTRLFLYQLVGTWGQILFPKPWKEFRLWYDEHKAKGLKPYLDGMVTTRWYKKMGEKIWTPWFVKFIQTRSYFNIYTNFNRKRALSVSHRDSGVNYNKIAGPDANLIIENPVDFNLMDMQSLSRMKWYDFCFREVLPGRIVRRLEELESVLLPVQKLQSIILVSILDSSYSVTRNLLCHFERLNIRNFLLLGSGSDVLHDLARRGHNVLDSHMLLQTIRKQMSLNFPDSQVQLLQDILVKAYVVKQCMESGYHTWILDSNALFTSRDMLDEIVKTRNDFYVGKSMKIFFARGSSSSKRIWSDQLLRRAVVRVDELSSQSGLLTFAGIVPLLLENDRVKVERIDDANNAIIVESANASISAEDLKKIIYWPKDWDSKLIQERLEYLSMWAIDGDLSCRSVVCHQD